MYRTATEPEISIAPSPPAGVGETTANQPASVEGKAHSFAFSKRLDWPKSKALIRFAALATFASGVANLYFAANAPHRAHGALQASLPLEFFHYPRSFKLFLGFALIVSAVNIYKRKRRAFQIVLALSALSFALRLLEGHDYHQSLWSLLLAGVLIVARKSFTVKSSLPDWRSGLLKLSLAVVAAFSYGAAGFWLLDEREFGINFNWPDSIHRTLRFLLLVGDPQLAPHTRHAVWFLDSLYFTAIAGFLYAVFALFRPIVYRFHTLPQERERAKAIIEREGRSSLDYFKLWPDKSYFFNSGGNCFVAYSVGANFAIALADPVGPAAEIEETIREFKQFCEDEGWAVAFHQTLPDFLPQYRRAGFKRLKLGDDAIVDLTSFTTEGRTMKKIRSRNNQLEKSGIRAVHHPAPASDALLDQLREVSDEWLGIPGRRERKFTLGQFDHDYLRTTPIFTVEDRDGRVLAFANVIHSSHPGEVTVDLMRHRADAPNGAMDYLFVRLFQYLQAEGYTRFNLGMAPMSGFQEHEQATATERAVHLFMQRMKFIFSFGGLKAYKAKFATSWEPRYLIYRNALDLPKLGVALGKVSELTE